MKFIINDKSLTVDFEKTAEKNKIYDEYEGGYKVGCGEILKINNFVRENEITHINFINGEQFTLIEDDFLGWCPSLISVNFNSFDNVETILDEALWDCESITSINLSALKRLEYIGLLFLSHSYSLEEIDLSALKNLEEVRGAFLHNCPIKKMRIPSSGILFEEYKLGISDGVFDYSKVKNIEIDE